MRPWRALNRDLGFRARPEVERQQRVNALEDHQKRQGEVDDEEDRDRGRGEGRPLKKMMSGSNARTGVVSEGGGGTPRHPACRATGGLPRRPGPPGEGFQAIRNSSSGVNQAPFPLVSTEALQSLGSLRGSEREDAQHDREAGDCYRSPSSSSSESIWRGTVRDSSSPG